MPEGTTTPHVSVREWTDVVRRARLGKTTKYVALVLATYADFTDGTRIYPGLATLAYAAEVNWKTAQKAVAELLRVGLIAIVKSHPGIRERGTEYRLILGEDLFERVDVPSPDRAKLGAENIGRARRRIGGTSHPKGRTEGPVRPTPRDVPADNPASSAGEVRPTGGDEPGEVRPTPRPQYVPPRSTRTPIDQPTTTTSHETAEVRTAVTVSREDAAENSISDEGIGNQIATAPTKPRIVNGNPDWRTLPAFGTARDPGNVERVRRGAAIVRANIRRPPPAPKRDALAELRAITDLPQEDPDV